MSSFQSSKASLALESTMANTSYTHNNPYKQSGWISDTWPANSPTSRSSSARTDMVPAQSSYGILPIAASPGVLPSGSWGSHLSFRFMANGNQLNMSVTGPYDRIYLQVRTNTTHTYALAPSGPVAVINWTGGEPVVERGGRFTVKSEMLRVAQDSRGNRIHIMTVAGRDYVWTNDGRTYSIYPYNNMSRAVGFVRNSNGVEICISEDELRSDSFTAEMLHSIIIAIVLLQGRQFVGLY